MHPDEKILTEYLEKVKEDLVLDQIAQGIRNTGESARSLTVVKGGFSGTPTLTGRGYWRFLFTDQGRRPGRFPPPDMIEDWILSKPVSLGDNTIEQLTFLISRAIAMNGTTIYQGKRGIAIDKIIKKNLNPAVKRMASGKADRYFNQLKNSVNA